LRLGEEGGLSSQKTLLWMTAKGASRCGSNHRHHQLFEARLLTTSQRKRQNTREHLLMFSIQLLSGFA
jgi:hypothetical protein